MRLTEIITAANKRMIPSGESAIKYTHLDIKDFASRESLKKLKKHYKNENMPLFQSTLDLIKQKVRDIENTS